MSIGDCRSEAIAPVRTALWLIGMLMVIAFPLQRSHSSLSHFRTHEVRRSVLRHTPLQRTHQSGTPEEAFKGPVEFVSPAETHNESQLVFTNPAIPDIPVNVFLTRLKLGHSHESGPDPLLQ